MCLARAYIDYLYFSIETLSTAGYGDMHPQTHYGHFIAAVELFTGIFSMSLMTGLIFARFSRPSARLLFADNPVISNHDGKPTVDGAACQRTSQHHRQRHRQNVAAQEYRDRGRRDVSAFLRVLPLVRNEHPALALSWTLYHVIDEDIVRSMEQSAEDLDTTSVSLVVVVSGLRCCCSANSPRPANDYDHDAHSVRPQLRRYSRHSGGRPAAAELRPVPRNRGGHSR